MKKIICHRRLVRSIGAILIALRLFAVLVSSASAHPLGNFTINHYSRLEISPTELRVRFVLDYAELAAYQERPNLIVNGEYRKDLEAEYLANKIDDLRHQLSLQVNGSLQPWTLVPNSAELQFLVGQGGLPVMRLGAWFSAPLSKSSVPVTLAYRDDTYADRLGWREIVVHPAESVSLLKSDVSTQDLSDELRAYPQNLLTQPLNEREANITFALGGSVPAPTISTAPGVTGTFGNVDLTKDAFAALIETKELSIPVILILLASSVFLGALHAFSPGHGKTIVGAYLVGSRGTAKHALLLGVVVTITHTSGVFALGLATLFASQYIVPDQLYPWLGMVSGALVALVGLRLLLARLSSVRRRGTSVHLHAYGHTHSDAPDAHSHAIMDDDAAELAHARIHIPSVLDGAPPTWQNLVSLGISGGLLPCPSALVVMLGAIALGRIALGLVLIVAFSIGLASVLILVGLALLYAGKLAERLFHGGDSQGWLFRVIPIGSAFVVMVFGLGIVAEALMQLGLIK